MNYEHSSKVLQSYDDDDAQLHAERKQIEQEAGHHDDEPLAEAIIIGSRFLSSFSVFSSSAICGIFTFSVR